MRGSAFQRAAGVSVAALALGWAANGCYQSYGPGDGEDCPLVPGCFDDAAPFCLDELSSSPPDGACRTIYVTGTTDDCADSTGRIQIARVPEGTGHVWMQTTVVGVPVGARISGHFFPEASCLPCGSGTSDDDVDLGDTTLEDWGAIREEDEIVFIGRGVRYEVILCALPPSTGSSR
jgi:hypothetical protein